MATWLHARLSPEQFSSVLTAILFGSFAMIGLVVWVALKFDENLAKPINSISSRLKTLAHADASAQFSNEDAKYLGLLAPSAEDVGQALTEARTKTEAMVNDAVQSAAVQKSRLEALLQEMHHGVIICSLSGRVSLYNRHALRILQVNEYTTSDGDSEPVLIGTLGLGRDLFNIVERRPFGSVIDTLMGAENPENALPIVFSTRDMSVTMCGHVSLHYEQNQVAGMTIVFDDVTDELAAGLERDRLLREASDGLGSCLANDSLDDMRAAVSTARDKLETASNSILASAWPTRDISAKRLFRGTLKALEDLTLPITTSGESVVINGDSATLIALLRKLTIDGVLETRPASIELRAEAEGFRRTLSIELKSPKNTSQNWLEKSMSDNADEMTAFLSGAAILERHRAKIESTDENGHFTITLDFPANASLRSDTRTAEALKPRDPRPEFYDFEIFGSKRMNTLNDVPLRDLYCVVFDCEMTGLDPRAGHEIVSIAGVRIVNGRVLSGEVFDQLVNPGKPIPPASTAIHHISDEMVFDAPKIPQVLRSFHSFAHDQVLIAHNAAFDMAFIAKKENAARVKFDHTVLDTVLLAAHLNGTSDSLTLDALANRYKITIPEEKRHTALGDAVATAKVFCKMIKPLESAGVRTVGDALEVSKAQASLRRKQQAYT
ncbi:MAG: exonuclease domain-containing protein [Pseudomonadota bacterium]